LKRDIGNADTSDEGRTPLNKERVRFCGKMSTYLNTFSETIYFSKNTKRSSAVIYCKEKIETELGWREYKNIHGLM
jgi:hypothetical protein